MTALETLRKYWQHDAFREIQDEIITSVLDGKDTFALLPTGGGKSICFQVPGMMKDGICVVVSPLIALMKDQVNNLQKRDIKAIALTGGLSQDDISDLLDNCRFGNYKFLYVSPERLQSEWIVDRIKALPVNLIAIDEAHCVSQWGHDFRPAYLKISELKPHFPKIPFLALTASATDRVQTDVITQLKLDSPNVFRKSFVRENLGYMTYSTEDKLYRASQILKKYPQPSIVYVRNRKSCVEVSEQLKTLGFTATFYHGGLHPKDKEKNMNTWMNDSAQVMVATNAFGMGIDKPDVKTVIHIQLPENLENYYQEAGRAGRNGEKAFAVLLTAPSDTAMAESQFLSVLPDKEFLTKVYVKLCNYFQIAYGEGIESEFAFNLNHFCAQYQFPVIKVFNALLFLDRQGVLTLSQEFSEKITAQFIIESKEVIRYMSLNPQDEDILLAILRGYPGIYDVPASLNISVIAKKSGRHESEVYALLLKLKERQVIDYQARNNDATLVFNEVREDERTINRVSKYLEAQNRSKHEQLEAVIAYVSDNSRCKSVQLMAYFGEKTDDCGICSYCISKQKKASEDISVSEKIKMLLSSEDLNSRELENLTREPSNDVIFALQEMLESGYITIRPNNKYTLSKK
ncbi:RecQ family ATP-dependent DNA helicase [Flavobacterium sp. MAH-1]|uniref:ATP-dependent DNA helicase RecQ n=1 Tax=Flavobacterium agri TaxID=2743471 RepID=A0A7Y8Y489_9FLAO|nr:ATP-dependent DNA helicase RecQ [Flavobacterium agri]NUY82073.1 RecQ family ATP-dependent DNA helicase [Flavobacterium agri]NYA72097.1 RecQ family ATP-dependent DNA helicase [Flavobacterium agri]